MAEGWIRAYRSRFENPLFEGEKYCKGYAWDWLVSNAAWKEKRVDVKGKIITLQRGQLSYSERFLAKAWGWSHGSVQRFLLRLQNEKMIRIETESGQSIISVCNYNKYQDIEDESETAPRQHRDSSESNNKKGRREEGKNR
jgi:DNA replication protein DnaD